ncbi:MAG: SLC13 family permease [Verrucomicrobiales bacterium]
MTPEIGLLLGLVLVALVFFSFEWVSADVVALGLLILLILTGILSAEQAFAGFGSDTVMTMLGLLILTATLLKTGVIDLTGRFILKYTGTNPNRLLLVIMIAAAGLSAFMSNTASAAFFLPIIIGIAGRAKISPSKFLMPLAFSTILTSSVTLISTSTNLVVSGLMTQYEMAPISMFELAPVGIPIAITGIAYMFFIGRRLIPDRVPPGDLLGEFGMRPYLSELVILGNSTWVGKTIQDAALGRDLDLNVVSIVRDKTTTLVPTADLILQGGDVLLVEGRTDQLLNIKDTAGLEIKADFKLANPTVEAKNMRLVEVLLMPKSPLIGRTLKGFRFRERYNVQVLGINRHGEIIRRKLSQAPLRMGDVMLVQGTSEKINALQEENVVQILGSIESERPNRTKAKRAVLIFVTALALGTFKVLSFPVAILAGAVMAFITKCISTEEAYRELEWKVIILIGAMLALGVAMEETGTASYLASLITDWGRSAGPYWLLSGFFVLTVLLTQPMSNQAAAVVILPIAVQTALQLGLNPRTFAMMICVAASCSYLTPLEPACMMVYGPGRYKFFDFIKVGSLLTLAVYGIAIWLVPKVWPLNQKHAPVKTEQKSSQPKAAKPQAYFLFNGTGSNFLPMTATAV